MSFSYCVYIDNTLLQTICNKPSDGSGFCDEHIQNTNKYNKLSMRILHHCFLLEDSDLINRCIIYHNIKQNEIDEVLSTINLSTRAGSNLYPLFRSILLSSRYFPAINNYRTFVSIPKDSNRVTWWIDNSTKKFILHKRFLISWWIQALSKQYIGLEDLLPRFLEPSNN